MHWNNKIPCFCDTHKDTGQLKARTQREGGCCLHIQGSSKFLLGCQTFEDGRQQVPSILLEQFTKWHSTTSQKTCILTYLFSRQFNIITNHNSISNKYWRQNFWWRNSFTKLKNQHIIKEPFISNSTLWSSDDGAWLTNTLSFFGLHPSSTLKKNDVLESGTAATFR